MAFHEVLLVTTTQDQASYVVLYYPDWVRGSCEISAAFFRRVPIKALSHTMTQPQQPNQVDQYTRAAGLALLGRPCYAPRQPSELSRQWYTANLAHVAQRPSHLAYPAARRFSSGLVILLMTRAERSAAKFSIRAALPFSVAGQSFAVMLPVRTSSLILSSSPLVHHRSSPSGPLLLPACFSSS